ncbi:DEAD/DEAH box helicase [Ruania albidiflava]|uniref:DEAD/DEAH box helicase n=1 Tax=Ruania albidiflava TaxID=366586 RepID=UPI0003B52078|nr:DEAD/DEAH box helicase [Ruania albidiflava]
MSAQRPDLGRILGGLKPFQRATVDHAFGRLWLDEDAVDRFLVADEVGLGKTLVAKGIAARAIDHLWDREQAISIAYICSNGQIARQNLRKLRELTGGELQDNADRLTMLPATMGQADQGRLQLIAFTPGTSLQLGNSTGRAGERVLLHSMLRYLLGAEELDRSSWYTYLTVNAGLARFQKAAKRSRPALDAALMSAFAHHLRTTPGPGGAPLLEELQEDQQQWLKSRGHHRRPGSEVWQSRSAIIGALRMAMASVSVQRLHPDLVILDEFQRFKQLFPHPEQDPAELTDTQRLAQQVIANTGTKVLILSATPYKMYTLPDEPEGDDHYRDFTDTISFLTGAPRAREITRDLALLREGILARTADGLAGAECARERVEGALRRVMSRTERLAATVNRDGMLAARDLGPMRLERADLDGWLATQAIAERVDSYDPFEFWRSAPYTVNLMDQGYKFQRDFLTMADENDAQLAEVLRTNRGALLDWSRMSQHRPVDPANGKLRAFLANFAEHEAWWLAWVPPSLPYLQPRGGFASEGARCFTKRLIFSAWTVVPKSITTLVSYETDRRLRADLRAAGLDASLADVRSTGLLSFAWDPEKDLPRNLTNLTVLYPCVTLARLGDPLEVARTSTTQLPLDRNQAVAVVEERVRTALAEIGVVPQPGAEGIRRRWYGVAPYLLDAELATDGTLDDRLQEWRKHDGEGSRLVDHMRWAMHPVRAEMGEPPEDLPRVLAEMALAGPGVCALRALARVEDGALSFSDPILRRAAVVATKGLRTLFSQPQVAAAVRAATGDGGDLSVDSYWNQVLRYGLDGNLQAVLDEYVHMLTESEGLAGACRAERAEKLADRIGMTAGVRAVRNVVHDVRVRGGRISVTDRNVSSHVAARFGRAASDEKAEAREATVHDGYTSPFWPFVLASTSVGQEGLDFHTYSHAVVHWNLPSNPVDLEQREGRVHRYKGHAVRKNLAAVFGTEAVTPSGTDPWRAMFAAAEASRPAGDSLINPYWVFPLEGGATIERYVPAMPLSREAKQYEQLQTTLGAYRFVMGQPRQEDLIRYLGSDVERLKIDLGPPA